MPNKRVVAKKLLHATHKAVGNQDALEWCLCASVTMEVIGFATAHTSLLIIAGFSLCVKAIDAGKSLLRDITTDDE